MAKENQSKKDDGQNRCRRCDRPLKDPTANYGWWCAKLVGLDTYQKVASTLDEKALQMYNAYVSKYLGNDRASAMANTNPIPIQFGIDAKKEYYYMRELLGLE